MFRFDSLSEVKLLKNVKSISMIMRGRTADEDIFDRELGVVDPGGERDQSLFYAENLRKMLCSGLTRNHWGNGLPTIHLCFQRC